MEIMLIYFQYLSQPFKITSMSITLHAQVPECILFSMV